ncbi:hypothetical protein [Novosphingobium lindaniclasticum]
MILFYEPLNPAIRPPLGKSAAHRMATGRQAPPCTAALPQADGGTSGHGMAG